jgi:hypothetical protein
MNTGAKDVLHKIRYLFIPYIFILCACLIIKLLYTRHDIYFAINSFHTNFLDSIEPYITYIGDGVTVIIYRQCILVLLQLGHLFPAYNQLCFNGANSADIEV